MQPTAASTSVTGHGIRGILLAVPSVITELDVTEAFRVVDLAGVLCNGIIGASIARQRRFDLVGLIILGTVSGLAGGVLRDVMLNVGQPVALTDPAYLGTALIGVAIALVFRVDGRRWRWPLTVIDALGPWLLGRHRHDQGADRRARFAALAAFGGGDGCRRRYGARPLRRPNAGGAGRQHALCHGGRRRVRGDPL